MDRGEELTAAVAYVRRGEALVERQREVVAWLMARGVDATVAREFLQRLETTLETLREHRDLIRREAEDDARLARRGGAAWRLHPHPY